MTRKPNLHNTSQRSLKGPELVHRFVKTVNDITPARYFVRAKQHQNASIDRLYELQEYTVETKNELSSNGNPNDANLLLSIEYMVGALIGELEMIVSLKENRPNDAWEHLLASRNSAEAAARAHQVAEKMNVEPFLDRLDAYEHLLFPSIQFVSPAFDVGSMICSICGEEYSSCAHIKGRAYSGEMCSVELRDIQGFDHLALVDEPYSKAHRLTQTASGKDLMTLLPPEECNQEDSIVPSSEEDERPSIDNEERPTVDSELETLDKE
ncbi:hypothetical protein [Halosimplex halophilum]|uniref:hypothetical protein n=1 Tax=Halosimplex halophilum TaxID=2559572 RepID=UPI00107F75B8|nr:hypothetical protein [Halosimplex halophilum]